MKYFLPWVATITVSLSLSSVAEADTKECTKAAQIAQTLQKKARELKSLATTWTKSFKPGGTYNSLHQTGRTLQKPIVEKYSQHFQKPDFLSKWTSYLLRRHHIFSSFRSVFKTLKPDLLKLQQNGQNLNTIKNNNFKLKHSSLFPFPRTGAPCTQEEEPYVGPCAPLPLKTSATFKNLQSYFTKPKLQILYNAKLFFTAVGGKLAIDLSISKTKIAIAEGEKMKKNGEKIKRLKREVQQLQAEFKRAIEQCNRSKKKRTFLDRSALHTRKCGDLDNSPRLAPVCFSCQFLSVESEVNGIMGGSEISSFEGNFQTADSWYQTDDAYNEGAQAASDAASAPWF